MSRRTDELISRFRELFGDAEPLLFSAPGRTEIGGNHTDHQHGKVLAAAVDADIIAAAAENGGNTVRIKSDDRKMIEVDLGKTEPQENEKGTSAALVRGICAQIAKRGYTLRGFDACMTSQVLQGSGLSSSAAFEVLIGAIVNGLFCTDELTATDLAIIGQKAENVYFGKPCGLMDQMASAWGGVISIDFKDPSAPVVTPVDFDFSSAGYSLCMVDVGADHANLTQEYAAIPEELKKVCAVFGKEFLRDVDEAEFYARATEVRKAAGDRGFLRAVHVFKDNRRVDRICAALNKGDFEEFLRLIKESGRSSWMYLQNVVVCGSAAEQSAAVALAMCDSILSRRGAYRIHGGGFGGTVQAFVPDDMLDEFKTRMEDVFGSGSCHVMNIRSSGFMRL